MFAPFLAIMVMSMVSAQFSNPPPNRVTWKIGEVHSIRFKTKFTTFSIALWQQAPGGGSATLGPIVFETTNDASAEFDWLVQTYFFDLETSNVFFFWMFEGATSLQGNQSSSQMSSSYFNIIRDFPASSSISTTATTSRALVAETPLPTSTYIPAYDNQQNDDVKNSGGLSVGAKAGVGVSVSVVSLAAIACIGLYLRHSKRQQGQILELDGNVHPVPHDQSWAKTVPIEMPTIHSPRLAELG
ncbi:hypothetical protein F4818DRAFT_55245 [Hypoxylon cercidicola]|nr:hypothetical protein F4818DRAFT_55245 [Hypoxylon cercidicola]